MLTASFSPGRFSFLSSGSKLGVALSAAAGIVAGVGQAYLISFINGSLAADAERPGQAPTFFGVCLVVFLASTLSSISLSRLAQYNHYKLRIRLGRSILSAPASMLHSYGPHRLMAILTDDIGSIVQAQDVIPVIFVEGSKLVAAFVYLGFLSPILLLIALTFLAIGLLSWQFAQQWACKWLQSAREADNALFGHYRVITEGYKELKMDVRRRRAFFEGEFDETANAVRNRRNMASTIYAIGGRWTQSIYFLLIGLILFAPTFAEAARKESLTGFVLTILFIGGPLSAIVNAIPALGKGIAASRVVDELNSGRWTETEADASEEAVARATAPSTLELVDVSYRYPSGDEGKGGHLLGPVNLRIEPGELVFLTGANGSGKTTLGLVILGLLAPVSGEIRLDGRTITREMRDFYRQNFSVVFADAYIFDSLFGASKEGRQGRLEELLAFLQLEDKLLIENGRFSTIDLSRGQRKRLALLSACLADRPFYFFDEWTAEQDPEFRDTFYRELLPALKARGKTVIVITHDHRYFHLPDRLLRLTAGRLQELNPAFAKSVEGMKENA
ncbi:cyclic peptide export ABC transporter [Methylosinus sp. H3A]|uniref:cyclic peptide export ABC transporter n=1 Tax=Methylosinus sp. H3A TaxID=2785786 RepID=UPI0018C33920|nr:cyclic peptide export ABC transporter [Methylosinus sp. H3A]MBG0811173.1 cyclic peptide export ABC transporter [Methylosinus sp. H3A]